jgi:hypothetical protein
MMERLKVAWLGELKLRNISGRETEVPGAKQDSDYLKHRIPTNQVIQDVYCSTPHRGSLKYQIPGMA